MSKKYWFGLELQMHALSIASSKFASAGAWYAGGLLISSMTSKMSLGVETQSEDGCSDWPRKKLSWYITNLHNTTIQGKILKFANHFSIKFDSPVKWIIL